MKKGLCVVLPILGFFIFSIFGGCSAGKGSPPKITPQEATFDFSAPANLTWELDLFGYDFGRIFLSDESENVGEEFSRNYYTYSSTVLNITSAYFYGLEEGTCYFLLETEGGRSLFSVRLTGEKSSSFMEDFEDDNELETGGGFGWTCKKSIATGEQAIDGEQSLTMETDPNNAYGGGGSVFVFNLDGHIPFVFVSGVEYRFSMDFRLDTRFTATPNGDYGILTGGKDILFGFGNNASWDERFGYIKYKPSGKIEYVNLNQKSNGTLDEENGVYTFTLDFFPSAQCNFAASLWMNGTLTIDNVQLYIK